MYYSVVKFISSDNERAIVNEYSFIGGVFALVGLAFVRSNFSSHSKGNTIGYTYDTSGEYSNNITIS